MVSKLFRLSLPSHRLEEPLLVEAASWSGALISIVRAQLGAETAELVVEVEGQPDQLLQVLSYLERQGVSHAEV